MTSHHKMINATLGRARKFTARGFGVITAIFLLVLLAGLGVAMITVSGTHQTASALDVQGARAYQAARAGIEWGLFQQLRLGAPCPLVAAPAPFSFQLPDGGAVPSTLRPFFVTVTCGLTAGPAATVNLDRRVIVSTACNQPQAAEPRCPNFSANPDYVQRVMQVEF